jgi:DNA-directed RNA polymerase subunit RPC12/RpoP
MLSYDPALGELRCESCRNVYGIDGRRETREGTRGTRGSERSKTDAVSEFLAKAPWNISAENGTRYSCSSCGGEIIAYLNTSVTSCPFCQCNVLIPSRVSGVARPEMIVPFSVTRKTAEDAIARHGRLKPLLPKGFREQASLEHLVGMYVPFWICDVQAASMGCYICSDEWKDDDGRHVLETYSSTRVCKASFGSIPIPASSRMPERHMQAVSDFDLSKAVPFSVSYLPGFYAECYDTDPFDAVEPAITRCKEKVLADMRSSLVYRLESIDEERADAGVTGFGYVLLPVWMIHARWQGDDYVIAMNGQTGRTAGSLPVDKGRAAALSASVALATALAVLLAVSLLPGQVFGAPHVMFASLVGMVAGGCALWLASRSMKVPPVPSRDDDHVLSCDMIHSDDAAIRRIYR